MRPSPLLSAAAAAALLAALAGPATAATPAPAKGVGQALSAGSLVQLEAAGKALEALRLQLPTTTEGAASALVKVTPLLSDGAPVGAPIEVGAGQSKQLPSQSAGVPGVLELVSPSGTLSAAVGADGPVSTLATGIGDLRLLGIDVLGDGTLDVTSKVNAVGSSGTKHLVLDGVALPSLADLLDGLGLDITKLPVDTLLELLDVLDLIDTDLLSKITDLVDLLDLTTVTELVAALEGELAAAVPGLSTTELQTLLTTLDAGSDEVAAVTDLQTTIGGLQEVLTGLTGTAPQGFAAARGSLIGDIITNPTVPTVPGLPTSPTTPDVGGTIGEVVGGIVEVDPTTGAVTVPVLDPVLGLIDDPALLETITDLVGDLQGVTTLAELVTVLQNLVTELVNTLTSLITSLLDTLLGGLPVGADLPALLDTPLLSIGKMDVSTLARTGANEIADVTGTVEGIEVLGTDVLDEVLGSSSVDLTTLLANGGLAQVQGAVDGLLGSVTDVLGDLTGLVLPLPQVEVLKIVEEVAAGENGARTARAGVEALRVDWALSELRIPAALSNVVGGVTGGLPVGLPLGSLRTAALPTGALTSLLSQDLSLVIGNLVDTSAFTVAAAGTPGTVTPGTGAPGTGTPGTGTPGTAVPQLPRTGASQALAALGMALMAGAIVARRRRSDAIEDLAV